MTELLKKYETADKSFNERKRIIKMAKSLIQVNSKVREATRSVLFSTGVGFHVVADKKTAKNLSNFNQCEIPLNNLLPVFFYLTDKFVDDTKSQQFIAQHSSNIIGMDYKTRSPNSQTLNIFKNASFHNLRLLELTIEESLSQTGPNFRTQNMISLFADIMRNSPMLETVFYVDARTSGLCNSEFSERILLPKTLNFLAIDTHTWNLVKNLTFPKGLPNLEHLHIQSQTEASICNCNDPEVTADINYLLQSVRSTIKQISLTSYGLPYQVTIGIPAMGQLELLKLRDVNIILPTRTACVMTPFPKLRHLSVKSSNTTVLNLLFGVKFENVVRFKYCGLCVEPCQSSLKLGGNNELDIILTERLVANFPNCTNLSLSWSSHDAMYASMPIIFQHMSQLKKLTIKIGCKYWDDATLISLVQVLTGIAPADLKQLTSLEWPDLEWGQSSLYNLKGMVVSFFKTASKFRDCF